MGVLPVSQLRKSPFPILGEICYTVLIFTHINFMSRSASLSQLHSLSPVQRAALRIIPLLQTAFAVLIVAQHNGYPIGF